MAFWALDFLCVVLMIGVMFVITKRREEHIESMQLELEQRKTIQRLWDDRMKMLEEVDDVPESIRQRHLGRRLPDAPYPEMVREFNRRQALFRLEMGMLDQR